MCFIMNDSMTKANPLSAETPEGIDEPVARYLDGIVERNLLRTLIDTLPDNIYIKDTKSRFVLGNIAIARYMKASTPDELVGKTDFDFYPKEIATPFFADEQEIIRSGKALVNKEDISIDPLGQRRWKLTTKVPLRDEKGRIVGLVGMNRDITDRKRTEEELKKAKEGIENANECLRYQNDVLEKMVQDRTKELSLTNIALKQNLALREKEYEDILIMLNSIGDAVIATDTAGHITRMNTEAEKMTGWSSPEAATVSVFKVLGINNVTELQKMESSFKAIVQQGLAGNTFRQISFTSRNGSDHQVNYSGVPIRNLDSSIVGVVLVIRDVTEQQRMEERLRQTQKMESLGHLASGIAHDLNNMMTGISGNAQMIQSKAVDSEYVAKSSKTILTITDSAIELVRNLLAFAHKTKIQAEPVDIHSCIGDAKNILDHSIGKKIQVVLKLNASTSVVHGESALLQNVIINLSLNARDAMPDGGILTIKTDNVILDRTFCGASPFDLVPGQYIALLVDDTGKGMSPEVQKRIFEPFFTTKELGKGTGLGLSAVYGIVKSHKGSVSVHSAPGQGTTFTVYLPLLETGRKTHLKKESNSGIL
jgi:PAS domain S-box-containing protein